MARMPSWYLVHSIGEVLGGARKPMAQVGEETDQMVFPFGSFACFQAVELAKGPGPSITWSFMRPRQSSAAAM